MSNVMVSSLAGANGVQEVLSAILDVVQASQDQVRSGAKYYIRMMMLIASLCTQKCLSLINMLRGLL